MARAGGEEYAEPVDVVDGPEEGSCQPSLEPSEPASTWRKWTDRRQHARSPGQTCAQNDQRCRGFLGWRHDQCRTGDARQLEGRVEVKKIGLLSHTTAAEDALASVDCRRPVWSWDDSTGGANLRHASDSASWRGWPGPPRRHASLRRNHRGAPGTGCQPGHCRRGKQATSGISWPRQPSTNQSSLR